MKYLRKFNENFNVDKDVHIEIIAGDIIDYLKRIVLIDGKIYLKELKLKMK